MPASVNDDAERTPPGQAKAVLAESLFLVNLLLLPGIGFAALALLCWRERDNPYPLLRAHLDQTWRASLWGGGILVFTMLLILILGGFEGAWTWTVLITYFTIGHSSLVMLGIVGLASAMSGQCWRFPILGCALPPGCPERTHV